MKIILFSAQARHSKDTCANHLFKRLHQLSPSVGWQRAAFADAVKNVFETNFGVNREFVEEWKVKSEIPDTFEMPVRQSLQFIGDGFRKIRSSIWVEIALRDETKNLIISDGRYLSEALAVREKDGVNVVVYRPNFLNDDPNPSESQIRPIMQFCAENCIDGPIQDQIMFLFKKRPIGIENYDFFLINDGTLEDLYNKIDNLLVPYIREKYDNP